MTNNLISQPPLSPLWIIFSLLVWAIGRIDLKGFQKKVAFLLILFRVSAKCCFNLLENLLRTKSLNCRDRHSKTPLRPHIKKTNALMGCYIDPMLITWFEKPSVRVDFFGSGWTRSVMMKNEWMPSLASIPLLLPCALKFSFIESNTHKQAASFLRNSHVLKPREPHFLLEIKFYSFSTMTISLPLCSFSPSSCAFLHSFLWRRKSLRLQARKICSLTTHPTI